MHLSIIRDADSKGALLFSLEDTLSMFPTKNFRFGLIWSQSSFLLSVHFKWVLGQRIQQCFWTMFTYGFFSTWQSFNLHTWVFRDSDFWKLSWSCLSVLSEVLKVKDIQYRIGLVPCLQRFLQILWVFLMMTCTGDDEIFKIFANLEVWTVVY